MTLQQMRDYIKAHSSDQFGKRVDKMPDAQIIAIYHRMLAKHDSERNRHAN